MQALEGVRILDLSGGIAGPLGVLTLAEHGADVIKIERPDRPRRGSPVHDRSRRSVTLDLSRDEGAGLFRELCATADVLVEAFASGTMERFGLGYGALKEQFPRLVYCSIPAWPSGWRGEHEPGYEALVHARTGQQWEHTTARPGPVFLHSPVASLAAAMLVPTGIMAALLARDRTGEGQRIEVSLLQGAMSLNTQGWNWTDRGQFGLAKTRPAGVHGASIYECAGGQWIHAAVTSGGAPTKTQGEILGIEEVGYLELMAMSATDRERYEDGKREAFRRRDRATLVEEMHAAGLSAEAIVEPHERFEHPQLKATGSVVEVVDPDLGCTTQMGATLFLESTPHAVQGPRPAPGTHTDEILRSLGHDDAELAALRSMGVI